MISLRATQFSNHFVEEIQEVVENEKFHNLLKEGWNEFLKNKSSSARCAFRVMNFVLPFFALGYVGFTFLFASLAMKQAFHDISSFGQAPIIGHFAEWSMLGIFSSLVFLEVPQELTKLGKVSKVNYLFQQIMQRVDLARNDKINLCLDKEFYLSQLTKESFLCSSTFPTHFLSDANDVEEADLFTIDFHLQAIYQQVKAEIEISHWKAIQIGWNVEKSYPLKKIFISVISLFFLAELIIYSFGIAWSAKQAALDFQSGKNPSIGGHCLEWMAEMVGVGSLAFKGIQYLWKRGQEKNRINIYLKYEKKITIEKNLNGDYLKRFQNIMNY